jgi:hypothetical protein
MTPITDPDPLLVFEEIGGQKCKKISVYPRRNYHQTARGFVYCGYFIGQF